MSNNPVDERRAKLDDLKAKGHRPFDMSIIDPAPTNIDIVRDSFDASFTKEDGPEFVIVGRCALKRGHGKLSFLTITSEDGQIQVAIDQSKFAGPVAQRWDWPQYEALDLGDIVAVRVVWPLLSVAKLPFGLMRFVLPLRLSRHRQTRFTG